MADNTRRPSNGRPSSGGMRTAARGEQRTGSARQSTGRSGNAARGDERRQAQGMRSSQNARSRQGAGVEQMNRTRQSARTGQSAAMHNEGRQMRGSAASQGRRPASGGAQTRNGRPSQSSRQNASARRNPNMDARARASSRNASSTAKRGKSSNANKARKRQLLIIEILVIVVLIIVLFVWSKLGKMNYDHIGTVDTNDFDAATEQVLQGYTTVALFGVDNRTNGEYKSGNSDSIMVASINKDTKEVRVISVFRDTYLNTGNDTYRKCNYAYNHGGAAQSLEMLNKNLDLNIQDYVAVDFLALAEAVDAVGGVTVDVTAAEADNMVAYIEETAKLTGKPSNANISAGTQTLDGVQTVAYCRIRYSGGDDFARAQRQRTVVMLLADKIMHANASQLNSLMDGVLPMISTSFSTSELLGLASDAASYKVGETSGFPFKYTTGTYGKKGSLVVPCTLSSQVSALHQYLFDTEGYTPTSTVQSYSQQIQSDTGTSESSASN